MNLKTLLNISSYPKVRRGSRISKNVNSAKSRHSCKNSGSISILLYHVLSNAGIKNGTAYAKTFYEILGSRVILFILFV